MTGESSRLILILRYLAAIVIVACDALLIVPTYFALTPLTQGCSRGAECGTSIGIVVLFFAGLVVVALVPVYLALRLCRKP